LSLDLKFLKELNHLTNSFAQLKQAQAKFKACIENVEEVKQGNAGMLKASLSSFDHILMHDLHVGLDKTILVPLTNSLYVPGKLSDIEHVIVDIGTGYYVKKVGLDLQF
jgi:prefoldin alpha subunit